ncbi:optic atrophy 3 protein-domain-containing protein [Pisolithus croceorrhizus]|nr:optic atrophy 3 protein-domain-containing protein [Pisolithus croceorrhizus]KAI6156330.1 optic atrophy 3 protein-domain-containing protein [Pisolithus thermaeus]
MATVKLATLVIRTVAKPISSQLKNQAKQHPAFRNLCVSLAQRMHTAEVSLRTNILGEPARAHVRPLSETRAIENGANALAEGFLFAVAAALIVGESFRTSRAQSKRRDNVDDRLDELATSVSSLRDTVEQLRQTLQELEGERERNDELQRIVERVVEIGLRGGWVEFEDTPLKIPKADLTPQSSRSKSTGFSAVELEPTSSLDVNSASSPGPGPS